MIRYFSRASFLAALLSSSVAAQKQQPPAPGTPKDFALTPRRSFTLPNGMRVSMVPFGTVPKIFVRLGVRTGHVSERENEVWLADVTGDMLQEGTTTRSAAQIARDAASMGGAVTINVGPDRSNVYGDVLSERGPDFVGLLADIVRHPLFPQSELPRIIANRVRQLAIAKSQPQVLAQERYAALLYPNHPYGRLYPAEAMLRSYTIDQVRAFHATNYGAARAHLYVTGVFDAGAMERAIRAAFSDWARGPDPVVVEAPPPPTSRTVALIDRPDAVQSTIDLGLRVPGPADSLYVPLVVTDALLGGAFGSRITTNIREDKGYTYSPFSYIDNKQRASEWTESADVTTKVTGASLKEIFAEIDRLQKEAPPAEELRGIENNLAGVFVLQNGSRSGVAGQLAFVDLFGLGDDYLTGYVRRVLSVSPDQVQRMAQTYLRPERMQLVVVGDKKVVQEQLAPWGTVVP
jgi:predicted Zn-dependent peptidase